MQIHLVAINWWRCVVRGNSKKWCVNMGSLLKLSIVRDNWLIALFPGFTLLYCQLSVEETGIYRNTANRPCSTGSRHLCC